MGQKQPENEHRCLFNAYLYDVAISDLRFKFLPKIHDTARLT